MSTKIYLSNVVDKSNYDIKRRQLFKVTEIDNGISFPFHGNSSLFNMLNIGDIIEVFSPSEPARKAIVSNIRMNDIYFKFS